MSEAVRTLTLRVHYEDVISGPARQFHAQEQARIRATSDAQKKAAKDAADFIARTNADLAAKAKAAADRASQAKIAADKAAYSAWKQGADAQHRQEMQAFAERQAQARADLQGIKDQARARTEASALLAQLAKDDARAAKQAESEKVRAAREAFAAWKGQQDQQHREAMQGWQAEQRAIRETARARAEANREANALLRQFARDEERAARDAARARSQANREANSLLSQFARDEARLARQVAAEKRQADRGTFQAWKAAQDVRHRETMEAWQAEQAAIKATDGQMSGLIKTGLAIAGVTGLASALGSEFARAAEYCRDVANQFADIRQAIVQVAALRDKQPTNKFTMEQIRKAEEAGLTPQQWFKAQEEFLNPAGAQIGNGPGAKMTDAQAQEFEKRVGRLTAAKLGGDNAGLGMGFAGSILQQSRGPLTPEQAMAQFNPAFEVLQKGSIDLRRAMPMMSQVMAHGIGATDAATLLNIVGPAAPGEEVASAEGALRAIEEMRVGGKGAQFGVTDKMTKPEAIKAFTMNMGERVKALRGKGKTDEEIDVEIARQLKEADVAPDIREKRGLIRGMYRQGVELGGFERYGGIAAKIAPDYDIDAVRAFEASDEGKAAGRRARDAASIAREGVKLDPIQAEKDEAKIRARDAGAFRTSDVYRATIRRGIGVITGVDPENQLINEETLRDVRERARRVGARPSYQPGNTFTAPGMLPTDTMDVKTRTQEDVDAEIRDLLRAIKVAIERQTAVQERPANPPPLVAMPAPRGR